jgi:hypothetical protein
MWWFPFGDRWRENLLAEKRCRERCRGAARSYPSEPQHSALNPSNRRFPTSRCEPKTAICARPAQYWAAFGNYWKLMREKRKGARRRSGTLHLAQAQSNRGWRGRKRDFPDAERLVKRLVAQELTLSFVPDAEQRLWRTVTRKKYQLRCDRVRLQNQVEALLEEAHIKSSSLITDLLWPQCPAYAEGAGRRRNQPSSMAAWRMGACAPPRNSCATRSAPVRS